LDQFAIISSIFIEAFMKTRPRERPIVTAINAHILEMVEGNPYGFYPAKLE
jgi:hypothetical protein